MLAAAIEEMPKAFKLGWSLPIEDNVVSNTVAWSLFLACMSMISGDERDLWRYNDVRRQLMGQMKLYLQGRCHRQCSALPLALREKPSPAKPGRPVVPARGVAYSC